MCELDGSRKQARWAEAIRDSFVKALGTRKPTPEDSAVLGCTESRLLIDHRDFLQDGDSGAFCEALGVEWLEFSDINGYGTFLLEEGRPPSRGGNTSAVHSHRIEIGGEAYYFKARGAKRWLYKGDAVKFANYRAGDRRVILKGTVEVRDKDGGTVVRGDRRAKKVQRSVETRLPVSRREAR